MPWSSILDQPGQLCACQHRFAAQRVRYGNAEPRNSGARSQQRSGMQRLRAHDGWHHRAHGAAVDGSSGNIERDRLDAGSDGSSKQGHWKRMRRTARLKRETTETKIVLSLNIDGRGKYEVSTGIRFFDHMLELFARHGAFDLKLTCQGDLDVDQHHTVEDVGIALGEAFDKAIGDK